MSELTSEAIDAMMDAWDHDRLVGTSPDTARESLEFLTASGHVQAFTREELEAIGLSMDANYPNEFAAQAKARAALDAMEGSEQHEMRFGDRSYTEAQEQTIDEAVKRREGS